jgi:F-type H+-transporting ATPase subunit a
MKLLKVIFVAIFVVAAAHLAAAAEGGATVPEHPASDAHASADHGKHELTLHPVEIGRIGALPITNSMIVTWIVALALIAFAQVAMRNPKAIPDGKQNFWEWLVESLYKFIENIIGHQLATKTFWFFATIFIFILFCNWFGLIPGVGTIGRGYTDASGQFVVNEPILRGANADLNMTFAMSLVFFACWIVWAIQANGVGGFIMHIFGAKGNTTGALKVLMIVVFFIVGLLEVVSILFRPVSLSFRLFGNIYAGESMLEAMSNIIPALGWLIPIPFYFLEVLVGMVQALVFMLLTAVFTLLITQHDESHAGAHH